MNVALRATEDELRDLFAHRLEILDSQGVDLARASAKRLRIPLERALTERARVPMPYLLKHLAQMWSVGFTDLRVNDIQVAALRKVKEDYATAQQLVAFNLSDAGLSVAMWDPRNATVLARLREMVGAPILPHLAPLGAIQRAHLLYHAGLRDLMQHASARTEAAGAGLGTQDASATDLLTRILEYAVLSAASDIHIEPYELEVLVRCRVDGVLHEVLTVSPQALPGLIARIKVLSGMRIDEKRAPQDGHFRADLAGLPVDLRVSSMPTHWGEKIAMRVVPKEDVAIDLEGLGLADTDFPIVHRHILRPFGMVLITGPTGSGKTTTLYAMIGQVGVERQNRVNISTIEDPVERPIARVNQIGVNPTAGINFAQGLRALLRQDPDVIMVGEIRDRETAEMAVRAALVGRLLLSTLHTNDAVGAVPRLLDMGVEPFLVASTLTLSIGQRLVRRICSSCRESVGRPREMIDALQSTPGLAAAIPALQLQGALPKSGDPLAGVRLYHGRGCQQCNGTGFQGRLGLFELFEVTDDTRRMITERRDAGQIRDAAVRGGMKTMFHDALAKVLLGETTLSEVIRATAC